ncbi:transglutaminase [Shewanella colwelliana]|uniref:Transglutaminase n=1 Tax=Shewanella colwelliana TaxID=23 RepID=A0ABQ4P3Q3_SHECO|nr:DUF3488 and transglutaminase-like domain-containing protein [Shewanella colwelliana]GIU42089.1 transglutaminase [Shewanella colwelliana]
MSLAQGEIIGRQSLLWLLVVNTLVLLPLYDKMTPWSMGICAICLLWRLGIFSGKVAKPPRYLVTALAVASAITLALVTSQIGMLNGLINLLILGYALKYIEMRDRRDVRAVVLVGYFLIAITFIEKQSLWFTIQLTLVATINTCVLVSLYRNSDSLRSTARLGTQLMLQSLPLALFLFVVLPRLPPLWLVPSANNATTGLSDEVSFGDIDQLTRSTALAFRVTFDAEQPNNAELYWRALVMENYDGKRWTQDESIKKIERAANAAANRKPPQGPFLSYEVITEPSRQHWLYGMDLAYSSEADILNLPDGRLYAVSRVDKKLEYRVSSFKEAILDRRLAPNVKALNLALPEKGNPKTRALALQFKKDHPEPKARLTAMMRYFNESPYFYTLRPPQVGPQQLDDFLFENKAGFCVHYASAFAFMARTTGLPARLVTGYQGGEWNRTAGYLSVYQYMAHAWVEVWLPQSGWTRYDPTAMIAPSRIDDGFDAFFNPQQSYLLESPFSTLRLRQYPLLNNLRLSLASIDYYWSKWVLGFDNERQSMILKKLLGDVTSTKLAIFMLVILATIGLAIAYSVGLLHFSRQQDKVVAGFEQICIMLAKKGVSRPINESPSDYYKRVLQHYPGLRETLNPYIDCYITLKYKPLSDAGRKRVLNRYRQTLHQARIAILRLNKTKIAP